MMEENGLGYINEGGAYQTSGIVGNNTNISHLSVKDNDQYEDLEDDPLIDFDENYEI